MTEKIYISSPHMSEEDYEQSYIGEAFALNWISTLGQNLDFFESEFGAKVGAKHGVALNSGTSALHLALKLSGITAGDRVFCQSLTFSATANPIIYEKAIPVFIGSEESTWNMCPKSLEQAFKKYPDTKAVLLVHLYGVPAMIDEIKEICHRYSAALIEDAAESLGATYKGKYTGTLGTYGTYSFSGNKIITTSAGGMLVSDDNDSIEKARFWAAQSKENERHYEHKELGFNYAMSNVLAGIGRGQLKVLDERVEKKKYIFQFYKKELAELEGVKFMPEPCDTEPNFWLSALTLQGKIRPLDVILALEKQNIEAKNLWKPMHMQPFFKDHEYIGDDLCEELFANGLCLPSDTKMTDQELSKVCDIIKELWPHV